MLAAQDRKLVNALCRQNKEIKIASELAIQFREMMENKRGNYLDKLIKQVFQSAGRELTQFAHTMMKDYDAIKNALTLPWSNGQVEGQINKLKTIKRQMYGRASFALLRKRLLLDSS